MKHRNHTMKTCTKCGDEKPLTEFGTSKRDGVNARCITCKREDAKTYREQNPETRKASCKRWQQDNLDISNEKAKRFYKNNRTKVLGKLLAKRIEDPEKYRQKVRDYTEKNRDKVNAKQLENYHANAKVHSVRAAEYYAATRDERIAITRAWQARNPDKFLAILAKRRACKRDATPPWYEKEAIEFLRLDSATRSEPHHVDHVIPLTNDDVCGLECLDNLEIVPAFDNMSKSNKFDQEAESARQLHITRAAFKRSNAAFSGRV